MFSQINVSVQLHPSIDLAQRQHYVERRDRELILIKCRDHPLFPRLANVSHDSFLVL